MNRKLFATILAGMVVIGVGAGFWLVRYLSERPVYTVLPVERGTIRTAVSADGTVVPEESAALGFEQNGTIARLAYVVGDSVKKGTVLASVDASVANAQVRQAEASVRSASATLNQYQALVKQGKAKLDSLKKSSSANSADRRAERDQIDANQAQVEAQTAAVAAAEAGAEAARAQWKKTVIVAPFDGLIVKQDAKVGEVATPGEPIVTVASPGAFKPEVFVSDTDIRDIRVGATADVTLDTVSGTTFRATVTATDPAATADGSGSGYKVTLHFDGDVPAVKSGMKASADITTAIKEAVMVVPSSGVFESDGKSFVNLQRDGKTTEQAVTTGIVGADGRTEIVSGLSEGDMIFALSR